MLTHFTIAQPGELLGSILARFIEQHRIGDDKVALQWLFDNRKVVPSAHLQGHIKELHKRVGHIWKITPEKIIYQHTLLPLFAPFTPPQRYKEILNNIIDGSTNTSSLRTGMNTGSLIWPDTYQVCPICLNEQKQSVGFY
ncbi:TniQ family protein, partial [Vibrio sp. 1-Bac 57]